MVKVFLFSSFLAFFPTFLFLSLHEKDDNVTTKGEGLFFGLCMTKRNKTSTHCNSLYLRDQEKYPILSQIRSTTRDINKLSN